MLASNELDMINGFLASDGRRFRYVDRRWWVVKDGYWRRTDARYDLQFALSRYRDRYRAAGNGQIDLTQHVVNRIMAHLSRELERPGLPAVVQDPKQDTVPPWRESW